LILLIYLIIFNVSWLVERVYGKTFENQFIRNGGLSNADRNMTKALWNWGKIFAGGRNPGQRNPVTGGGFAVIWNLIGKNNFNLNAHPASNSPVMPPLSSCRGALWGGGQRRR
jgi:hypothetical protein